MAKMSIVIGQYFPAASPIHRLDARAKILITFLYLISLFVSSGPWDYLILSAVFVAMVALARLPFSMLWRGMKLVIILVAVTFIFNALFVPGEEIASWWIFHITREGLIIGALFGLRILLLIAFGTILTLTTKPMELTDGMERLMYPLKIIKVPAHEIAMVISIALRFIPTLLDELERIILAQRARGGSFRGKKLMERIRRIIPMIVPLFVSALRRADELAQAMDAKCYHGGEGRTHWRRTPWKAADTICLLFFIALLAYMIYGRIA